MPVAPFGGILSQGLVRETGREPVGVERWAEIRRRWSSTRASGRPACSRSATGRRFGAGLLAGHGRAVGGPARTLAPAGTAMDHADTVRLRERDPHGGATAHGRAREAGDGGFRSQGARIRHRLLGGRLKPVSRSHAGGRRSVIWPDTSASAAAAVTSRFACRLSAASIGVERGGGVAVQPGVGRFAAARGSRATPGRLANARPSRLAVANLGLGAQPSQSRVLHQAWKPRTPQW